MEDFYYHVTEFKCLKAVFIFLLLTIYILLYRRRCLHESQRKTLWVSFVNPCKSRSSRLHTFFKLGVLKNLGGWSFCSLFIARYFLLVARCLLLFASCLLLFAGCSLLFAGCSLLFAGCSLFFRPNYCEIK